LRLFRREDLWDKALVRWGSEDSLQQEKVRREQEKALLAQRKRAKAEARQNAVTSFAQFSRQIPMTGSNRVVFIAVGSAALLTTAKVSVAMVTGSAALLAESSRSVVDLFNQGIYLFGVIQSARSPDRLHPYGYTSTPYVSALAASGFLLLGGGLLGMYSGIHDLWTGCHAPLESGLNAYLAAGVIGMSLIGEGYTLFSAVREMAIASKRYGLTWKEYVLNGPQASVASILAEDSVAFLGNIAAAASIYATVQYQWFAADAIVSFVS
jgi:zinc transporter 9